MAASMELGSAHKVSIEVSKMTPPTLSLTILGKEVLALDRRAAVELLTVDLSMFKYN